MPIQFPCNRCQKTIQTPDGSSGKECRCPECGDVMVIPPASDAVEPERDPFAAPLHPLGAPAGPTNTSNPYAAPTKFGGAPAQPPMHRGRPHRGGMVLTFGIIGTIAGVLSFCCWIIGVPLAMGFGIPAWVMGSKDLKAMKIGQMDPQGRSQVQAGMVLGIIAVSFASLGIVFVIVVFALQFAMAF